MMRALFVLILCLLPLSLSAQSQVKTSNGTGAKLRALDTLTGKVTDLDIAVGQTMTFERLNIFVKECRYPKGNVNGDAFALIEITDVREDAPRFDAWMVASSPALSALEHPRYDVWLMRCSISDG